MRRILIFSIIAIILLAFSHITLKHMLMWDALYPNSNLLSKEESKEIKSLLLNVMKERHSRINVDNIHELYTREIYARRVLNSDSYSAESVIVIINQNFMNSVSKTGDNHFIAEVQLIWPDDWLYFFTIKKEDGYYRVSDLGVDP